MAQKPAPYKIMNHDMAKSAYKAGSQNFVLGIIRIFLIALILSLGFGQLLRFDFLGVPLYLHDILVVSTFAMLLLNSLLPRRLLNRNSRLQVEKGEVATSRSLLVGKFGFNLLLAGLAVGSIRALTIYPVTELLIPSLYTLRLLAYLTLYCTIKKSGIQIPKSYFLISGVTTFFIGLTQYFLMPDMRIFQYLGWDDHLSRLTLPHYDPTFTGVMLSLFLLSIFPTISYLMSPFILLSIMLTYSRSVWISLIITAVLFIKNKLFLLLAIGCIPLAIYALPQRFGEGTNLLRTFSIVSRFDSDLEYLQKYKWDLLAGRGLNTLILEQSPSVYANHPSGPNNSYLYLLLTTGVIGLVGWGIFMYSLYKQSARKPMLIFFFIASLFNNVMFYPFALLWVLLIESNT